MSEESPLLQHNQSAAAAGDDDANKNVMPPGIGGGAAAPTQPQPSKNSLSSNISSLLAVYAVGAAGWFVSYKAGAWDSVEPDPAPGTPEQADNPLEFAGLTLGYVSAVFYLWYVWAMDPRKARQKC